MLRCSSRCLETETSVPQGIAPMRLDDESSTNPLRWVGFAFTVFFDAILASDLGPDSRAYLLRLTLPHRVSPVEDDKQCLLDVVFFQKLLLCLFMWMRKNTVRYNAVSSRVDVFFLFKIHFILLSLKCCGQKMICNRLYCDHK